MAIFSHGGGKSGFHYPYRLEQSCRFNSADNPGITGDQVAVTHRNRYTVSVWVKPSKLSATRYILGTGPIITDRDGLWMSIEGYLEWFEIRGGAYQSQLRTTRLFRDVSSWYHIVAAYDSDQATDTNRMKLYVNGVRVEDFTFETYTPHGHLTPYLNGGPAAFYGIGKDYTGGTPWDGYLSEYQIIDGQQLPVTDFGELLNGIWVPKKYNGTYGNNGRYYDFSNSSHFGEDQSGNNNDLTDSGLATNDQVEDNPTNNYCTMNPLDVDDVDFVPADLSNGNLDYLASTTDFVQHYGTMYPITGKWYFEATVGGVVVNDDMYIGISSRRFDFTTVFRALYSASGNVSYGAGIIPYGDSWVNGDVIGVAVDIEGNSVEFFVDNVSQGPVTPNPALSGLCVVAKTESVDSAFNFDFGQLGFTYAPPAGYRALNSANLPQLDESLYLEGNKGFDVVGYTGTGAEKSITDLEFSPDLVWLKSRDEGSANYNGHQMLFDTIRGATNYLISNVDNAEDTDPQTLKSFDSKGFTLGTTNKLSWSGDRFVSWNWKEDPAYGFDIVSYTGNAVQGREVPHSLGVVPEMMILKNRDDVNDWTVYHYRSNAVPKDYKLKLNTTDQVAATSLWDNTAPTSSVFTVHSSSLVNGNGDRMIAYLFASVEGFSKVFSYTGNASDDGPFIYCGFRPSYVLLKSTASVTSWVVHDTKRNTYNLADSYLLSNTAEAEGDAGGVDFLSNGFKLRTTNATWNPASNVVGVAFAETPFKYANAR